MNRILVTIGLIIGFLSMLLDGFISYTFLKESKDLSSRRSDIIYDITCLKHYLSTLVNIENEERGYLITGNQEYLESYHTGVEHIKSDLIKDFIHLKKNDPDIKSDIIELQVLTDLRLKELEQTLKINNTHGFEAAKHLISNNSGKKIMDRIQKVVHKILIKKQNFLNSTKEAIFLNFKYLFYITVISNILSFSLIATCLMLLSYDIKRRKKTEEDLLKLRDLQEVIVESTREAIMTVDQKGTIYTFNSGSEKLFKRKSYECIGKNLEDLLNYPDNQATLARLSHLYKIPFNHLTDYIIFAAQKNIREDIPLVTTDDGQKRYVVFSASKLPQNTQGIPNGYLLEGTDVTERKIWEEELKIAHLKAEAGNIAKSQFLANISHDIRTPLTAILGFTEILKNKNTKLDEKEIGFLNRIENNGKILMHLIDTILDLERIEVGKLKIEKSYVDVGELIKKITEQLEIQFHNNQNLKLLLDIPSRYGPIYTDAQKLTQILMNLIGNSIKFTNEGFLKITLLKDETTNTPNQILISDSGIGINKDELPKIFDAFYQARGPKSSKKMGSGLGLAIVKSLCDLLDYQISVESEPGKGTTFTITLS